MDDPLVLYADFVDSILNKSTPLKSSKTESDISLYSNLSGREKDLPQMISDVEKNPVATSKPKSKRFITISSVLKSDNKKKRKDSKKLRKSKSVRPTLRDHTKTKVADHDGFKQTETETREVDNNVISEDAVFTDNSEVTDSHDIINLDFIKRIAKDIDSQPNIPDVEMNPLVVSKPASRQVVTLDSSEQSFNKKHKRKASKFEIRRTRRQQVKYADHTLTKADELYSFEREDSEVNVTVREFDDDYIPEHDMLTDDTELTYTQDNFIQDSITESSTAVGAHSSKKKNEISISSLTENEEWIDFSHSDGDGFIAPKDMSYSKIEDPEGNSRLFEIPRKRKKRKTSQPKKKLPSPDCQPIFHLDQAIPSTFAKNPKSSQQSLSSAPSTPLSESVFSRSTSPGSSVLSSSLNVKPIFNYGVSHIHCLPPEESILRCKKYPAIFIRKFVEKTQEERKCLKIDSDGRENQFMKSKRVYDNYHCCCFCGKLSSNIIKHLRTHKEESEVAYMLNLEMMKTKEADAEVQKMRKVLRQRGDYAHNIDVIQRQCGEMILTRRERCDEFNSTWYRPCPHCLEWLRISSLKKHSPTCLDAESHVSKEDMMIKSDVLLGLITPNASDKLIREVFSIMRRDEETAIAQSDGLIVALGEKWLKMNISNKVRRKYYTSEKMRRSARFLLEVRKLADKPTLTFNDCIKGTMFDICCEAALRLAKKNIDDEEDLASPTEALKMGFDLMKLVDIKEGFALKKGGSGHAAIEKQDCKSFFRLMKIEWTAKVSKLAHNSLRERHLNKKVYLPLGEDLVKLAEYLKEELGKIQEELGSPPDYQIYKKVTMLVQARLLLYNKRRSGELEQST